MFIPAAQAAFAPLGYPGPVHVPGMYFNMYTAPGFLGLLLTVINFLLIVFLFTDITAPESDEAPGMYRISDAILKFGNLI